MICIQPFPYGSTNIIPSQTEHRGPRDKFTQQPLDRDRILAPRPCVIYINAASHSKIHQAFAGQLPIRGGNRVLMDLEPAGNLPRTRQLFRRAEVAAGDAEPNLCDKLFVDRHLRVFRNPKFHRKDDKKHSS